MFSLSPLVERQLREIAGNHHQVAVEPGGTIRASKTWQNIGAYGFRHVAALYGTGDTLETFVQEFGAITASAPVGTGVEITTNVDVMVSGDVGLGLKNALVGVGSWDPVTSTMYFDDYDIVVDAIEIKWLVPVGVQVSVSFAAI